MTQNPNRKPSKTMLAALYYIERGFAVYAPAYRSKLPNAKTSGVPGRTSATATRDADIIRAVYNEKPRNNVAIRLDMCEAPLCTIDTDTYAAHGKCEDKDKRDGEDVLLAYCEDNAIVLPDTVMIRTASCGIHRLYRYPEGCVPLKSADNVLTRVDFLGVGHGEVMPPSVIVNKKKGVNGAYEFVDGLDPDHIEIAELPIELYRLWEKAAKEGKPKGGDGANPKGRNNTLFDLCRAWYSEGKDEADVMQLAKAYNASLPDPLPVAEVEKTVRSAKRYAAKFSHNKFGDMLISDHHMRYIEGMPSIWNGTHYAVGKDAVLLAMCDAMPSIKRAQRSEVWDYLELQKQKPEVKVKQADARYIAFANGVLDLRTMELLEPSPELCIPNVIPHNWNPDAVCVRLDQAIFEWGCENVGRIRNIRETIGMCMWRGMKKHCPVLEGERGANGKSTFLNFLTDLLGDGNVSHLDIAHVGERFRTKSLLGKLANVGDDIQGNFIEAAKLEPVKKAITCDWLQDEYKGGDEVKFRSYATLVFSCNRFPKLGDNTGGMWRRFVPIPFEGDFLDSDEDMSFLETEEAFEHAIVLGVNALRESIIPHKGKMTMTAEHHERILDLKAGNSSVAEFAIEELGFGGDDAESIIGVQAPELFKRYVDYCERAGIKKAVTQTKFNEGIRSLYGCRCEPRGYPLANGKRKSIRTFL